MRSKEQAHDYRYFPEPDLPPVVVDDAALAALRPSLPELPEDRFARYTGPVGLSPQDAGVLVAEREIAAYFDAVGGGGRAREARRELGHQRGARRASTTPRRLGDADLPVPPRRAGRAGELVENGTLSGKLAKDVFAKMWAERRTAGRHRRGRGPGPGLRRRRAGGSLPARHRRPPGRGRPLQPRTPS